MQGICECNNRYSFSEKLVIAFYKNDFYSVSAFYYDFFNKEFFEVNFR